MNVILEGPDGGGKSTLARHLHDALGMRVQQGSGPPKSLQEIVERANQYMLMEFTVFDRHPCVSQMIYGAMRGDEPTISELQLRRFYEMEQLIVYCRTDSLARHVVKPDESLAHVAALTENYNRLVAAYDAWAVRRAHLIYRMDDTPVDQVVDVVRVVVG